MMRDKNKTSVSNTKVDAGQKLLRRKLEQRLGKEGERLGKEGEAKRKEKRSKGRKKEADEKGKIRGEMKTNLCP
jgi:hypothetical protein